MVSVPLLVELRVLAAVQFSLSNSTIGDFRLSQEAVHRPLDITIYSSDGTPRGALSQILDEHWNQDKIPLDLGEHRDIELTNDDSHLMTDGQLYKVAVHASVRIESRSYFNQVPVTEIQGFKDELTGKVHTRGFTIGQLDADTIAKTWRLIESPDSLAVEPVIRRTVRDPSIPDE